MVRDTSGLAELTTGGLVFNYACPRQTNSCVRRVIEMAQPIDRDIMSHALEITRKRFPQLSLALVKTRQGVHERFHDEPFELGDFDQDTHYMGEDSGGHLIAFFVKGRMLVVDYFHAIADDAGIDKFIQSLLYHYLALQGHRLDNSDGAIITSATSFDQSEGENSGSALLDPHHEASDVDDGWKPPERALRIVGERRSLEEPDFSYTISVPLTPFMQVVRHNASSPAAVVSTLFSRALWRRYARDPRTRIANSPRAPITAEVAVNLRNHFPTRTVRCFTGNVYLPYDQQSDELPVEQLFADQAASIRSANTPQGMLDCYNHAMRLADKTFNVDVAPCVKNWIHKHIATRAMSKGMTYGISNIGKVQLPQCLKPHVTQYYSQIPSGLHAYLVSMRSEGDRMTLCVTSKLKDSGHLVEEFVTELRALGIRASIVESGDFHFTRYIQNRAAIERPQKPAVVVRQRLQAASGATAVNLRNMQRAAVLKGKRTRTRAT